uniref:Uncharacterized protein n=1 Tax=Aegilops tauschii TaxID=37682 RepID=M8CJ36_AEGTA
MAHFSGGADMPRASPSPLLADEIREGLHLARLTGAERRGGGRAAATSAHIACHSYH